MSESENNIETVTVKLGGEDVILTPSSTVLQAINRRFGDPQAAFNRVAAVDFDALAYIIAHGTGKPAAQKAIAAKIYAAGILTVVPPVSQFLSLLLNGGRAPDAEAS